MYKAEVVKKVVTEGKLTVGVIYSKGKGNNVVSFRENIVDSTGKLDIHGLISKRLKELDLLEEKEKTIVKGEFDNTPTTPEPVSTPTPEQVKRSTYSDKLEELQKKKRFVDLGVLNIQDISALQVEVKQLATELGEI